MVILKKLYLGALLFGMGAFSLPVWASSVNLSWHKEPSADIKKDNDAAQFYLNQITLAADLFDWQGQQEALQVGANLQRSEIDWGDEAVFDESYYWLGVPLRYRQVRSANTEIHARLEPGFMGTQDGIKKESFFVNGDLSLRFYRNMHSYAQLGLIVDRSFGDAKAYPLAMVAFKPDNITEVKLGFPYSSIQANWSSSFSTYAKVKPAGGMWIAAKAKPSTTTDNPSEEGADGGDEDTDVQPDENDGQTVASSSNSKKIKYQSWQLGVGSNIHWRDGTWLNAEVGYLFQREIRALGVSAKPKNALFWQVGLKFEF